MRPIFIERMISDTPLVVCLDETSRQLLGEGRPPVPTIPGRTARQDPEDVRGGVAHLLLTTEPLQGWRAVRISTQRTRLDCAACRKELVDVRYPDAERIVLGLDQRNTHSPAAVSAAFPSDEAARRTAKLEIPHTPKHGSWLNLAELEVSVRERQCLRRRLADQAAMTHEVSAWAARRKAATTAFDGHCTTADACSKLRRLYPAFAD